MSFISRTIKKKTTQSSLSADDTANTCDAGDMTKCPKCGEVVTDTDERKSIMGKDWHLRCVRCDNCDRSLASGTFSAYMNKPYCNPCFQLKRNNFATDKILITTPPARRDTYSKSDIKSKIKDYNLAKTSAVDKLKSREASGKVVYEGLLKLYWGLRHPISLSTSTGDNRHRQSVRGSIVDYLHVDDDAYGAMMAEAESEKRRKDLETNDRKLQDIVTAGWDSRDRMPRSSDSSEGEDFTDLTKSLPASSFNSSSLPNSLGHSNGGIKRMNSDTTNDETDGNAMGTPRHITRGNSVEPGLYNSRSPVRKRSASFRKIAKQKKMEGRYSEMPHMFIPPYGTPTSVRVTSIIPTKDVLLMLIAKYKVENSLTDFALCVVHENGTKELLSDDDYPLQRRLKLGPNEQNAKIFVVEAPDLKGEQLSEEVQTWIKFTLVELQSFARKFEEEEEREEKRIRKKFDSLKGALQEQINATKGNHIETDV